MNGAAIALELELNVDDSRLFELAERADKVGIDVPFGWPDAFVSAVRGYGRFQPWPASDTVELRFRRTDLFVRQETGRWPLSVSTDRIGITAFRAARLLSTENVDRAGRGKYVEVYPRAARDRFDLSRSVEELLDLAPWLELDAVAAKLCMESEHCMDAVIAALIARASALGLCEAIPGDDLNAAAREGWIVLPRPGTFAQLISC